MDVDEVLQNPEDIEDQKIIFMIDKRRMTDKTSSICLKNKHSYPNTNSIADLKILSWKRKQMYAVYEHYSLYREFPEDKRKSRSPSKKLSENYIDFLEEVLESNSNLKNNAMVKLLKDKFEIEVSESAIRRALQEHDIIILNLKYSHKNT